jgi:hypothetical protein
MIFMMQEEKRPKEILFFCFLCLSQGHDDEPKYTTKKELPKEKFLQLFDCE